MSKQFTLVGVLSTIVALIAGGIGGNVISDNSNSDLIATQDSKITELEAKLSNQTVITNTVEVEIEVPSADALLDQAKEDAWMELSDDDEFLVCSGIEYDEDEVTLSRITDWSFSWIDKDESQVAFTGKYRFDSSDDDDRCTETRKITVSYEDGEKPVVKFS